MKTIFILLLSTLPVIRAHKKSITIRDGNHLKINFWALDPGAKPDTYFTDFPRANNTVTFITDLDSISFNTAYGHHNDFVILLNDKDSCFTRISAGYNGAVSLQRLSPRSSDTIPFLLRNNRIYFTGTVNGHKGINIMFDLGAGTSCVNIGSIAKTGIQFDSHTLLSNTNGTNSEPSSSSTTLLLGPLRWDSMPVVQVRNLDAEDDMIIGNSLFRDQTIEINYDRQIMVVHYLPPTIPAGYIPHPIRIFQHRPFIKINLLIDGITYSDWFLFDTGRDGTMLLGDDVTSQPGMWQHLHSLLTFGTKKIVVLPSVQIDALTFTNVLTNANDPAHPNGKQSLLGNAVLKQFNVILDNRHGILYLKPNSLQGASYSNWPRYRAMLVGIATAFVVLVYFLIKAFKKKKGRS